ncbi:MAG: cell division protein SepF [Candidatus Diapherotrites archaeon]|nr:cell division protein SepF [Candidatus Diapherotrites archaeon]
MVGFLKKISSKIGGSTEDVDIDEFLETIGVEHENLLEEEADMWVKPYLLQDTSDAAQIINDLNEGNIVILNIEPLYKRNSIKLKQVINELKGNAKAIDGDIVRITEYKLLLTPKGVKVAKTRK